jgi:hypothetical protein
MDDVVILVPGPDAEPFALAGGAALWSLLDEARTTHELLSALTADLTVGVMAEAELDGLLARLAEVGAVDRIPV